MIRSRTAAIIAGIAIFIPNLVSCGPSTQLTNGQESSVGQQLTDLDNAYRQGIISEREYHRLKKALIARYD